VKGSKRKRSGKKKRVVKRRRPEAQESRSLEVPKLTGDDEYELWRSMIELKLKVLKLSSLVTEEVTKTAPGARPR
jgi:hypothetical protein